LRDWHKPMRPPSKVSFLHSVLLLLCIAFLADACPAQLVIQSPPASSQPPAQPPMSWSNELRDVANKVAAISPPPARIELEVNNFSSLGPGEAASISDWLRSEFARRGFRVVSAPPVDGTVTITLSEGVDGYLIVAQVRRGPDEQIAMIPVPRGAQNAARAGEIILDQERIWEQPGVILDFALPQPAPGESPMLVVLEPGRIVTYSYSPQPPQWQLSNSVIIPPLRPWLRAPRGYIDLSRGLANGKAMLSGIDCTGDFRSQETVHCAFENQPSPPWAVEEAWTDKNIASAGDSAGVDLSCNGRAVVLATGGGDWTRPDFIQGYEMRTSQGEGAIASGNPLEFAGPVTAIWPTENRGVARAVVHNLQSGNYEAYIVKATCSH